MKHYQHISKEERFYIDQALQDGKTQREIAIALQRDPSTISRELKRNKSRCKGGYHYSHAIMTVFLRKRQSNRCKYTKLTKKLKRMIIKLIKQYLSPEQVSGYLKEHKSLLISHETIYRYIYSDAKRKKQLKPFMRQGLKRSRKPYGSGARVSLIPNRTSISERPAIVETKRRYGDIEVDTVIGKESKSVLVTLVDRKSLYTLAGKAPDKTADSVRKVIIKLLKPYQDRIKTLTFDNGTEFVQHAKIAKSLKVKTYFAHPYSSWERGINENTNGLLRQFFPKGTDFLKVTTTRINRVVESLNNRPRKTKKYKTPNQLFNKKGSTRKRVG